MKKCSLILCTFLATTVSYASNNPVSLSIGPNPNSPNLTNLYIQSNENSVEISNVIVNRGNCKVMLSGGDPIRSRTLRFGDEQRYLIFSDCNPKEVQVVTNYGTVTFNTR